MDPPSHELIEQIPALVYIDSNDLDPKTLYISPEAIAMLGHDPEDYRVDPGLCDRAVHPDDRERVLLRWEMAFRTGEPFHGEYRIVRPDGVVVWVIDDSRLIRDERGEPQYWLGVLLDISERKGLEEQLRSANEELELRVLRRAAELIEANEMMAMEIQERTCVDQQLREAREVYRHLVEDLPAVVYRWHVGALEGEGSLSYTSPQIDRLLGYTAEEWDTPSLWIERLHPHDRERALAAADHSEATGEPYDMEYRYLAKDGRVVWVHSHATLLSRDDDGNPLVFQGVMIDITDRKEADAKAADFTERFRTTMLGSIAFYDIDVKGDPTRWVRFHFVTPALAQLISVRPEDLLRDPTIWLNSIHPDDAVAVAEDLRGQLDTGRSSERNYRVIAESGRVSWVRTEARCVARDDQGRPSRFQGVIVDVTREKEEHERERSSDAALRAFVDTLPGIPWTHVVSHGPGSGRTVYLGPQVERLLGYTQEELLAEPEHFARMIHPEDRDRIRERSIEHDTTLVPWSERYRMIARDGRIVSFRSEGLASRDEQGSVVWHGIAFDVTGLGAVQGDGSSS